MRTRFTLSAVLWMPWLACLRRFFSTILVFYAIISSGCASFPASKQTEIKHVVPSAKLEAALQAKGVDRLETTSDPRDVSEFFTVHDEQVVLWVKLGELAGVHHLRWDWYTPSGELYVSSGDFKVNSDGKERPYSTAWHKIAVKGEKAATLPGQWKVLLFLDGEPAATRTFLLRKSSGF